MLHISPRAISIRRESSVIPVAEKNLNRAKDDLIAASRTLRDYIDVTLSMDPISEYVRLAKEDIDDEEEYEKELACLREEFGPQAANELVVAEEPVIDVVPDANNHHVEPMDPEPFGYDWAEVEEEEVSEDSDEVSEEEDLAQVGAAEEGFGLDGYQDFAEGAGEEEHIEQINLAVGAAEEDFGLDGTQNFAVAEEEEEEEEEIFGSAPDEMTIENMHRAMLSATHIYNQAVDAAVQTAEINGIDNSSFDWAKTNLEDAYQFFLSTLRKDSEYARQQVAFQVEAVDHIVAELALVRADNGATKEHSTSPSKVLGYTGAVLQEDAVNILNAAELPPRAEDGLSNQEHDINLLQVLADLSCHRAWLEKFLEDHQCILDPNQET